MTNQSKYAHQGGHTASTLSCRRCGCARLIMLDKRREEDHDVYRCQECGYLFSPP